VAPPRPGQLPAPPRTLQRRAPDLVWPGSPRPGLIQCKLTSGQVGKVVKKINQANLVFDDANPSDEDKIENFRLIAEGLRAEGRPVIGEHVRQVAKSLGGKAKTLSWIDPDAIQVVEEVEVIPHLEDFPKNEAQKLVSHDPQDVSLLIRIDGKKVDPAPVDADIRRDISTPDASSEVTTTTGDGEVSPLILTLSAFVAYLETADNQAAQHHFTVALVGPYGPCNGCKKRLTKFVQLWSQKATELMANGVNAKLTITYKYAKKPQVQRDQYYGYEEDSVQKSPYLHTLTAQVTGTNAA
jgi:hypothetical protein